MVSRHTLRLMIGLGLGLSAPWLQARVFRNDGPVGNLFNPGSFGAQVYQAVMQINGGYADVSVAVCEGGWEAVRVACAAVSQDEGNRHQAGESMAMGKVSRGGKTVRWVALEPEPRGPLLLVSVTQPASEAASSYPSPARHGLEDVPLSPDARVLSLLRNGDTRTTLERVSSRMTRESLALFHEGAMTRQGWVRGFRTAARTGLSMYIKGSDLCWVRIGDTDSNGETRVTLLHKAGAVKQ